MSYCHSEACNLLRWKGKLCNHGYRSTHIQLPWLQLFSNCIAIVTSVLSPTGITQSMATAADMVRTTAVISVACCTVIVFNSHHYVFFVYFVTVSLGINFTPENWDCVKSDGPIHSVHV